MGTPTENTGKSEVDSEIGDGNTGVIVENSKKELKMGTNTGNTDGSQHNYNVKIGNRNNPIVIGPENNLEVNQPKEWERILAKEWERILAWIVAIGWIGLIAYLVIRNEPLDPNLFVLVRIVLSVMAGILGAVIPGFLVVDLNKKTKGMQITIRAGGALALVVISFFFTPTVLP